MQRSRRALLTISLAGLVACGKAPETTAPPAPISVTAVPVVSASVQEHVEVLGRVRPIQAAEVTARVSGQLTEVSFEFGTAIEAGAPLFQVDREPFQIAVDAATAKVTSAEALWGAVREVEQHLRERLEAKRVLVYVVGWEVPHVHVHLLPTNAIHDVPFPAPDPSAEARLDATAAKLA